MLILGIETSCDETSVALVEAKGGHFIVHENLVSSQIKIHRKYGGVVPEVAARRHVEVIIPLLKEILRYLKGGFGCETKIKRLKDYKTKIDIIAVTAGPGLVTSLLVGVETARTLAYLWKKPLVAVNHLEGHIYANWLAEPPLNPILRKKGTIQYPISNIQYPILCLIVSGGHTELILMKDHLKYKLIGQTRDDAAGECFDKVGKMLGLPYPGGPEVAKLARKGNPQAIDFPRPMMNSDDFGFSFSGLKTAVLYYLKTQPPLPPLRKGGTVINNICASFQQAAVDVLVSKTLRAAEKFRAKTILLGGGVATNQALREQLSKEIKKQIPNIQYLISNIQYYSDNAAMIAAAAYFHAIKKDFTLWQKLKVKPNWELV